jgi:hypothetical protein
MRSGLRHRLCRTTATPHLLWKPRQSSTLPISPEADGRFRWVVVTTMPMNDQLELVANDIGDDLGDQQTNDLLTRFNACAG